MSDQVTLPPGITSPETFSRRWSVATHETVEMWCEAVQHDAVMAERRRVASAATLQQLINRRVETINAVAKSKMGFGERLTSLLNEFSAEHASNTPDFVLAGYLQRCLENWNATSRARCKHFDNIVIEPKGEEQAPVFVNNRGETVQLPACKCGAKRVVFYLNRGLKFCYTCRCPLKDQSGASNRGEVLPEFCYCCTAPLFYCIGSNKFCTGCHGLLRNQATV